MNRAIKVIRVWTGDFESFEKADLSGNYNDIWVGIDDLADGTDRIEAIKEMVDDKNISLLKTGQIDYIVISFDD